MSNQQFIDPAIADANLLMQPVPGITIPFEYDGVRNESAIYRTSAWIGTVLMSSPVYDVYGPQALDFLQSICVNDFTNLKFTGLRHAVICNDNGQILTDGIVIRIAEDRYRTYWLNPPIQWLCENSDLDVHGEDMSMKEYFIQIQGEKSLEILEDAFQADLHDIKFAKHRIQDVDGMQVRVIRIGMTGNLAYEIHGPMCDYVEIYNRVWESGKKFGAKKQGQYTYTLFNHTECGFPNINIHYPLPWFESWDGLTEWCYANPALSNNNINRALHGSVGDDLESRFVTPYDTGMGFLVKFNHDFIGKAALEKIASGETPRRDCCVLEWNSKDVGKVFAAMLQPGSNVEDITDPSDIRFVYNLANGCFEYIAQKVLDEDGNQVGIATGRIISYNYGRMISLAFVDPSVIQEGRELTVLWGTPGTDQMEIRATVARHPYNTDLVRNEELDVAEVPVLGEGRMVEAQAAGKGDWSGWYESTKSRV